MNIGERSYLAKAEAYREIAAFGLLQRTIPMAVVDRDRAHLDAMIAGIAHDLRRRVETHRLGVEQSGTEYVGMMMLHPARGIGDLRQARCMALRKAIAPEALHTPEGSPGKNTGVNPPAHSTPRPR